MSECPRRLGLSHSARPGLVVVLLAAWIAGAAGAQETAPPDVPSGPATLRGRVVHSERPGQVGGVSIALYSLDSSGHPGTRRTETAPDGTFAFEGISNDPNVVYLVGARYAGLPFPGDRVVFKPGETEHSVEVQLFEPSDDLAAVHLEQSSVRISLGVGRLQVAEVHRLRNDGERVFYVPAERRPGHRAPLEADLLPGVEKFAMPLGVVPEGAERKGRDFKFWGPIYPGEQEITFRYEVPIEKGPHELVKRFPSAAEEVRILDAENGPVRSVDGMKEGDVVDDASGRTRPWEAHDTAADFAARIDLDVPEMRADPGSVRLTEGQLVLEIDDATLQAQEQYRIEVDGSSVLHADPGDLLLSLPLPKGAEDIRFSASASSMGLVNTEDGLGIVGPLDPGEHDLAIAYSVRSGPDGVALERHYDRRLPLLRMFVADTGVAALSHRLHRRRPVRDADRTYLIFEAFEVDPGEPVDLSLRALPPRGSESGPPLAAAVVVGLAAFGFLLAPLGRRDAEAPLDDEAAPGARDEREHLYESIRDLDHDYETGKLDEEGWRSLRAELRARAVTLLAQERARAGRAPRGAPAQAGSAPAAAPALVCGACGSRPRPGDRFCASCGARIEAGPGGSGAGGAGASGAGETRVSGGDAAPGSGGSA